jgi:hypothetical protein
VSQLNAHLKACAERRPRARARIRFDQQRARCIKRDSICIRRLLFADRGGVAESRLATRALVLPGAAAAPSSRAAAGVDASKSNVTRSWLRGAQPGLALAYALPLTPPPARTRGPSSAPFHPHRGSALVRSSTASAAPLATLPVCCALRRHRIVSRVERSRLLSCIAPAPLRYSLVVWTYEADNDFALKISTTWRSLDPLHAWRRTV